MNLAANDVAQYLKDHPDFFNQYAELLAQLSIPDPHGGRAISITERQIIGLREQVKKLEASSPSCCALARRTTSCRRRRIVWR
jgi:uncharacterized protein YigA (DUF484 family)